LGTRLIQIRVPEEILRRIDRYVLDGMYRSRSELILDATRRFLERTAPSSPIEMFIGKYLEGRLEPVEDAKKRVNQILEKVRSDGTWRERFGTTPRRGHVKAPESHSLIFIDMDIFMIEELFPEDEKSTSIYNLLELCGLAAFTLSVVELTNLFTNFNRQYSLKILYPKILKQSPEEIIRNNVSRIFGKICAKMNYSDA